MEATASASNGNKRQKTEDPFNDTSRSGVEKEEEKKSDDTAVAPASCCPNCNFPVMEMENISFTKLLEMKEAWLLDKTMKDNEDDKKDNITSNMAPTKTLCSTCKPPWEAAAAAFCHHREQGLVDPFHPEMFPAAMFQMGGVPVETMKHLISLKQSLIGNNPAGMRRFGKLNYTDKNNGKFFYFVGDKSSMVHWTKDKLLTKYSSSQSREALIHFAEDFVQSLLPLGKEGYRADPGFVMTQKADVQAPHRDYKKYHDLYDNDEKKDDESNSKLALGDKRNITKSETKFLPWVLHLPLVEEGMWLNYWPDALRAQPPVRLHIPFGTYLLLRVDAVHGGIFGEPGNLRLHVAFSPLETTIHKKGLEWKASDPTLTDAIVMKHEKCGAPEAGIETRELDKLRDYKEYYQTIDVNECNRAFEYKMTFHEDGYRDRLRLHWGDAWDPTAIENLDLRLKP